MKKQRAVNLLWVDDESETLLEPLGRMLQRQGFILWKATNYADAIGLLDATSVDSLLVDIILPSANDSGALISDLGLVLADRACTRGVRVVTFLTVLPLSEVKDKYEELKKGHPQVQFQYLDKTLLLDFDTIERLSESLRRQKD